MAKHLLSDLTWYEARERLRGDAVVLLPFGSQEEQGPHAPMGDYMITARIAEEVASRSGALAAPTVPFGYADYFKPFAGAICLRPETFSLLLEDMCTSMLDHGLERLVILNGHSGNAGLIDQTVRRLRADYDVLVPSINLWRLLPPSVADELYGGRAKDATGHGADPLTSVYQYLFPDLVRMDLLERTPRKTMIDLPIAGFGGVRFSGSEVNLPVDADDISDSGIAGGDPSLASPEIGQRIFELIVTYCVDFVAHFRTVSPRAPERL